MSREETKEIRLRSRSPIQEKKVLHLRSTFHAGGTENLILHFFNTPSDAYQIILVLMKPGSLMQALVPSKNQIVHLYRKKKIDLAFFLKLIRLVKKQKPDYIHTHQPIELFYAVLVKLLYPSIRLIHQIHLYNPKMNYEYFLEKFIVKYLAHSLIVVSYTLREQLVSRGYPMEKMKVLLNIVQRTNNLTRNDQERFLRRIHFQAGDQLIGMVGNFVPEKDQITLARAFNLLMDDFPDTKLIFIGKRSPEEKACKQVFEPENLDKRVFFTGQWNYASELFPFFALSVFSSNQETFGIAAIESLLYEVPLIASDIPVMKELSDNGQYFELFERGNPEDLAWRIARCLTQPPKRAQLKMAREYAEEAFNTKRYVNQIGQLYH